MIKKYKEFIKESDSVHMLKPEELNMQLKDKRIELVNMNDPYTKLKPGDKGTCNGVDSMGNILMKWDNGSSLSLIPGEDYYKVLSK